MNSSMIASQTLRKQKKKHIKNELCHEKPAFCICKNKGADQLHGNRAAEQRLCFRYIKSTIPLLNQQLQIKYKNEFL